MTIVGVDLSGPANPEGTALVRFSEEGPGLRLLEPPADGLDDQKLVEIVSAGLNDGPIIVGLDSPLSYNPGGGDRPADQELRKLVMGKGLKSGAVMCPTGPRMAYLTLRGVCVARALGGICPTPPRVVEVHPGASLVLRGAPVADLLAIKQDATARRRLLEWLERQGLREVTRIAEPNDHAVAACACALAAWKWALGDHAWCWRASLPLHPYDFAG